MRAEAAVAGGSADLVAAQCGGEGRRDPVKDTGWPIDQVSDHKAAGCERVGDQPPMAAPPEGLGTHDCHVIAGFRPRLELNQGRSEGVRTHIRSVGREGG